MKYKDIIKDIIDNFASKHCHFYVKKSKSEIDKYIDEELEKGYVNCEEDLAFFVRKVIKESLGEYDSHTRFKRKERYMPFRFKFLKDGFYVISSDSGFEHFNFAKLISINGVSIDTLYSEIEEATCYSTVEHLYSEAENILSRTDVFLLPSVAKDHLTYELEIDGKKELITVNKEDSYENKMKGKQNYGFFCENDTLILTYNSCSDIDKMMETVSAIKEIIEKNNIQNFVLDLRGNDGGNSMVIMPLIDYLKTSNLNIVTLVDRYVFSSGRWAVKEMEGLNSYFIGENLGTSLNCFGENMSYKYTTNESLYSIAVSIKYFGFDKDGNLTSLDPDKIDYKHLDFQFFSPNLYVNETIDDYKNHKDPYLDATYSYLENLRKSSRD